MAYKHGQKRQKKHSRITSPGASSDEIRNDFILASFDGKSRAMDLKWGVDRLPDLVSLETARVWGVTMANLNTAIEAQYTATDAAQASDDIAACVASCLRGFDVMDAEAEASGAPKADDRILEFEMDGTRIGVMADGMAWQSIKAARPDLVLYSMREVANALEAYNACGMVIETKKNFPAATITSTKPKPDYENGGDPIDF